MLVNPWGLWWAEVCTSDILTINADGDVVDGEWDVTPAFHIHTELHRRRRRRPVIVHNHPMYATALRHRCASRDHPPELVDVLRRDGLHQRVRRRGRPADLGAELAERVGEASVALLSSHGVLVTAPTIEEATYKSVLLERTCKLHWLVRAMDRHAVPDLADDQKPMKASLIERAVFGVLGRRGAPTHRAEPEVLD